MNPELTLPFLKTFSLSLALAMYIPLWVRILRRKTSGDISLWFQVMLLMLQATNGVIAWVTGAGFFIIWYIIQMVAVGITIALVWYYYD